MATDDKADNITDELAGKLKDVAGDPADRVAAGGLVHKLSTLGLKLDETKN